MRKYSFYMATAMLIALTLVTVNCGKNENFNEQPATSESVRLESQGDEASIQADSVAMGEVEGTFFDIAVKNSQGDEDIFIGLIPLEFNDGAKRVDFEYSKSRRADGSTYIKLKTPILYGWHRYSANILVVQYFNEKEVAGEFVDASAPGKTYVFEYLGQSRQISTAKRYLTVSDKTLHQLAARYNIPKGTLANQVREFYLNLASTDGRRAEKNWQQFLEAYQK